MPVWKLEAARAAGTAGDEARLHLAEALALRHL
jgi:hypothetical protein